MSRILSREEVIATTSLSRSTIQRLEMVYSPASSPDAGTLDEFGQFDWHEAGRELGMGPLAINFARHRSAGLTQTEAARRAGYAGKDDRDFSVAGSKSARSPKVRTLMALASKYDPSQKEMGDVSDVLVKLWSLGQGSGSVAVAALQAYSRLKAEHEMRRQFETNNLDMILKRIESGHPELAARIRRGRAEGRIAG